ncbi:MAG: SH3 domain-containing protein [Clostridia bacterium]
MPKRLLTCALVLTLLLSVVLPSTALARDELKNTDPERYYIVLDTMYQVVTVFEKDDNGEYTRIVRRMVCTSGKTEPNPNNPIEEPASPTPAGVWKIGARERFGKFANFGSEYARYWTQVVGGIYFHSIMFSSRDINKLKTSAFSRLGSRASHGCIRLYVEDAKWLYYYACPGTTIKVTSGEVGSRGLAKELKTDMSFKEYNEFQKKIFDDQPLPNNTAWVVTDDAQMRTGNGTNDKFIRKLSEGTEAEVLQEGDPWVKVLIDGREGYVKRAYVTYEKGVLQSTPDGKVAKATLFLYAKPSTKSERLCKVARDSSLVILEEGKDFTKINYWGIEGYIQTRSIGTGWATIY